jgi:hypothetical protein
MKRFISYPSIEQYRNVIVAVNHMSSYQGQDENDEPIYSTVVEKETIKFRGTVKLHGTNAGVIYNTHDSMWAQSRKNIITPEKDNAGFAFYIDTHQEQMMELVNIIKEREHVNTETHNIAIFGEFCGGNIQKGVAITGLDKMFVIFGVKIAPYAPDPENHESSVWVDHTGLRNNDSQIYNVEDFPVFDLDIDFNRPDLAQAEMVKLVDEVEACCPVGKSFGVEGIGEGLVWKGWFKNCQFMFKTKGTQHSASKVKTMAPVDVEKMNSIHEFVEYACTDNRLQQGVEMVFTINSLTPTIKQMGDYIRWVVGDITKEESDTMATNKLEPKDVNKHISVKARIWFQKYLDEQAGM